MIRNLKALGLASLAVFAMGAMAASAAQAEVDGIFTASEYPATIVGTQTVEHVFTRQGRTVKCTTADFHGELTKAETTLTLEPHYTNCHSNVLGSELPATVTMNGCDYVFHATVDIIEHENGEKTDTYTAVADLECPEGKLVEIHVYANHTKHTEGISNCTITIPEQTGLETFDLTNLGTAPNNYILAHLKAIEITSTVHGSLLLCGSEHDTAGKLEGTGTFEGENEGEEAVGLTVSTDKTE